MARILTVTVSDSRVSADDASGRALREELSAHTLLEHVIVPDEPARIEAVVRDAQVSADAVVMTGGTGIAPRDQTYDTLTRMFDKELPGFGEAFRRLSWDEIGPRAVLSRAAAGTVGSLVVFSLPGSTKAARLGARELIAPIVAHATDLAQGRTGHGRGHGHSGGGDKP